MPTIHLLLIENDPVEVTEITEHLAKKNTSFFSSSAFQIHQANSLDEAPLILREQPIDLVLLDLDTPELEPGIMLKVIHQLAPETPIVVLTGRVDEELALRMIELGAEDCLFKDALARHQLLTAIYYGMERQRKDRAWRKSEARFRVAVDNMLEGFAIFTPVRDGGGKIVDFTYDYLNEAGSKLNLTTRDALIGKPLLQFLPNHLNSGIFEEYVRVVETGQPLMKEMLDYQDTWSGTPMVRSFDIRAVKLEEGLAVLWRDITEQIQANKRTQVQAGQMAALYQTSLEINSRLDLNTLVFSIIERAVKLTGTTLGGLFLVAEPGLLRLVGGYNLPKDMVGTVMPCSSGLNSEVIQTGKAQWVADYQALSEKPNLPFRDQLRGMLAVPLKIGGKVIGIINVVDDQQPHPFSQDEVQLVQLFADQAAIAIENGRLYREMQQLSITDDLTGAFNRRGLFQLGEREVERSRQYRHPFSIIMADIDHFKELNDQLGHRAGDEVLVGVTRRVREHIRGVDLLARYGGDEFVIALVESSLGVAYQVAERLRRSILEQPFDTERGKVPVSLSLGVAEMQPGCRGLTHLLEQADQALYRAKQSGRNCISAASPHPVLPPIPNGLEDKSPLSITIRAPRRPSPST